MDGTRIDGSRRTKTRTARSIAGSTTGASPPIRPAASRRPTASSARPGWTDACRAASSSSGGRLARIEEDTNGDGAIDKWETYAGGVLSVLALDLQHRGKPDRKLIYRPDGTLDRIEVDPDGTGRFQPIKP